MSTEFVWHVVAVKHSPRVSRMAARLYRENMIRMEIKAVNLEDAKNKVLKALGPVGFTDWIWTIEFEKVVEV